MKKNLLKSAILACVLTVAAWLIGRRGWFAAPVNHPQGSPSSPAEIAALKTELERLKGIVPDQAHAMKDVAYHFDSLWFAGQHENWPLAEFYWGETRSHLRWATRIIPVRKDPQGREVRVADMLVGIEASALEPLHAAIKEGNPAKFATAYQQMMTGCYSCHVAAGKPFLRLQIPKQPVEPMIQFDPAP